jgi:TonB family protein
VGEHLVKEFEKQAKAAEKVSNLKLVKSPHPSYPDEALKKKVEGSVIVRIVVNKDGNVISAKAVSGPPELIQSSVEAAKQYQFEPTQDAPVTADLKISFSMTSKPCPPGKKGEKGEVSYGWRYPMKTEHAGQLNVVGDIDMGMPPYPREAWEAGKEGDLELFITVARSGDVVGARVIKPVDPAIDEAALATVRTWKFKVTRGEQAGFPIKILYRVTCDFEDD